MAGLNPRFPGRVGETSFVHHIFGGYLRSQLRCPACGYKSNTYDPFLDLSLGLPRGEASVTKAMRRFTAVERLGAGEEWRCPACKRQVRATKVLRLHRVRRICCSVHPGRCGCI